MVVFVVVVVLFHGGCSVLVVVLFSFGFDGGCTFWVVVVLFSRGFDCGCLNVS